MKHLILISFFSLAACAGHPAVPEPIIVTKEVSVPVAMPCVPETYDATGPAFVDSNDALKSAADAAVRYQLLWAGREQRIHRQAESDAVISGCPRGSAK